MFYLSIYPNVAVRRHTIHQRIDCGIWLAEVEPVIIYDFYYRMFSAFASLMFHYWNFCAG